MLQEVNETLSINDIEAEVEATEPYPEMRLWAAIVLNTVAEYELWLRRMQTDWLLNKGKLIRRSLYITLKDIEKEVRHSWFDQVCELAGVSQDIVINKLAQLDKQYGLLNMRFTDSPEFISEYAMRKARKRQYYA